MNRMHINHKTVVKQKNSKRYVPSQVQANLEDQRRQHITLSCKEITGQTLTCIRQNWLEQLTLCSDIEGINVKHIL